MRVPRTPSGGPQVPHTGGAAGKQAAALAPALVLRTYWVPSARSTLLYTMHCHTRG
jgi:hypothetical protein